MKQSTDVKYNFDDYFKPDRMSKKIRELMEKSGYSERQLAERMGVTEQSIYNWCRGSRLPDYYNLYELGNVFGVSLDELFGRINNTIVVEYEDFISDDYNQRKLAYYKGFKRLLERSA